MTRSLLFVAVLAALYFVVVGGHGIVDLLAGAAIGSALLAVHRRFALPRRGPAAGVLLSRVLWSVPLAARVAGQVATGTFEVLRATLTGALDRGGIVEIPIGERSAAGTAFSAFAATLSPDSFLLDVNWAHKTMLFHVVDASRPERIRQRYERFYQRYQRRVVP